MPDFRVIIGGGKPRDQHRDLARIAFRRGIIWTLRAVARGEDDAARVVKQLNKFWEHLQSAEDPRPDTLITEVFGQMREDLQHGLAIRGKNPMASIVIDALRVAAESCAVDDDAPRRASKRLRKLSSAIDEWLVREGRCGSSRRRRAPNPPATT
jgi:hypothetical protein